MGKLGREFYDRTPKEMARIQLINEADNYFLVSISVPILAPQIRSSFLCAKSAE
jgi:hypothetical protein